MDIAALSISLNQAKVQQKASVSVMKMAMDNAKGSAADLEKLLDSSTKGLEQPTQPHLGSNIDVKF